MGGISAIYLVCRALVDRHLWPLTCQSCMWKAHWFDCFPSDTKSITVRNWFSTSLQYPMGLERILNWSHPGHSCWLALAEPLNCCSMGLDHFPTLTHTHPNRPVKPTSPPHAPPHPPFSNAQYTCTASLALTFNMSKLNSLVFSLLPLRPCFALFARAAAVRRRPKRLC